ncbi:hypothetical protein A11A3_05044 [Alcanivorax hongdengensis A-11-3]|uniref:Uncharacterized protein n=2 Tax=Alcanivorax hongdengensis TaxID=519051 RepID=L0WDF5_9GAMM|nr:hypothetical protein A11A3_05044 [Alcanivorax hongdengensis A-11-3]
MGKWRWIIVSTLLIGTATADTVLRKSPYLAAFGDYLTRPTVSVRHDKSPEDYEPLYYELRQGEKIDNGCRTHNESISTGTVPRIERRIAKDMHDCTWLILIGKLK